MSPEPKQPDEPIVKAGEVPEERAPSQSPTEGEQQPPQGEGVAVTADVARLLGDELKRGRGRRSKKGPAERRERRKDPIQERAQKFYDEARRRLFRIVYGEETMTTSEEGVPEPIPIENWSYARYGRQIALDCYGFQFKPGGKEQPKGRQRLRPEKNVATVQSTRDHTQVREELKALMSTRFAADQQRIDAVLEDMRREASESGDETRFLSTAIKHKRNEKGIALQERLARWMNSLENQRWLLTMDGVDWFAARVNQAESVLAQLTAKTTEVPTLGPRLRKIDVDTTFTDLQQQLQFDIQAFQRLRELEVKGSQAGKIKERIDRQIKRAERMLNRFDRQIGDLRKIAEKDGGGYDRIQQKREIVERTLLRLGTYFSQEADKETIGLSPEQELNFWQAIIELFDEVATYKRAGKGESQEALDRQRLKTINNVLHIFEIRGEGRDARAFLVRGDLPREADAMPQNFDQVVEKARADALLLVELRQKLRQTFAIMGRDFVRAVQKELRGHPNQEKNDMVDQLNGTLARTQKTALDGLNKDTDFSSKLGDRDVRDLKWRDQDDAALLTLVRTKTYELSGVGTERDINREALKPLLEVEVTEEVEVEAAIAAEIEEEKPYLLALAEGVLEAPPDESEDDRKAREILQGSAQELWNIFETVVRLPEARSVILGALSTFEPEQAESSKPEEQRNYLLHVLRVVVGCQQLRSLLGRRWLSDIGLVKKVNERWEVDHEWITKAVADLDRYQTFHFVDALNPTSRENVRPVFINKIEPALRERFTTFGINDDDILSELVLYTLPPDTNSTQRVDVNQCLSRLANYLEGSDERGRDLLIVKKLGELSDDETTIILNSSAIASVYQNESLD